MSWILLSAKLTSASLPWPLRKLRSSIPFFCKRTRRKFGSPSRSTLDGKAQDVLRETVLGEVEFFEDVEDDEGAGNALELIV
jgi:hypothetical protein